ncbi:vacuolar protein-sorting-associated protein 36 [Stomoxys calcitrans]|uniref:Vacuolar protein-sorting-associated protein 36 n=1 Tax=Stomoxys calcitrans TaxID=35570 RepID=A0A1I8Q7Z0_STOCA|nr:vacuolar protein-sorting-associated protein 36 [Stomoxys calcitrans]
MNRFEYAEARLHESESFVNKETQIKLYDGDQKTQFEEGELVLTTHRMFWGRPGEIARAAMCLCLNLKYIVSVSEEQASNFVFGRKTRLVLHLRPPASDKQPGPLDYSSNSFIKLSGKHGVLPEFANSLRETLQAKIWEVQLSSSQLPGEERRPENHQEKAAREAKLRMRTGIGGIERAIEQKTKETDENIALAFQDLRVLMAMAQDMVSVSRVISDKIRSQKGEISDDETVRFKSYLLSLGIDDPVTREAYSSDSAYYKGLAEQICVMLLDPLEEAGGMMSLADVYCRVNRARGLELLSPEDLLQACHSMQGPIKLRKFPSGAMVLQLDSQNDELTAEDTVNLVNESTSLAVEELAKVRSISLILAKERLLAAERMGKLCRDESLEGLRFYPNFILQPPAMD